MILVTFPKTNNRYFYRITREQDCYQNVMSESYMNKNKLKKRWKWLSVLGPGLTTGAADDDPSGIATYAQTGAQFGYGQLWTALYMLDRKSVV